MTSSPGKPTAVVLGGYGFIGAAAMRALKKDFDVIGVGRKESLCKRADPHATWRIADLATASELEWQQIISGADLIVNASGALQDGQRDNLERIHVHAVSQLARALSGSKVKLIHISAAGVSEYAANPFMETKHRGEDIIRKMTSDWMILRPTLVLGSNAYGGSSLLRALAAIPAVEPTLFENTPIQALHVDDLGCAIADIAADRLPWRQTFDLTEPEATNFPKVVSKMRAWLGYSDPKLRIPIPDVLVNAIGRVADLLSILGWRSPLRRNAIAALRAGITGDANPWTEAGGRPFRSLDHILAAIPSTSQEHFFARAYLILPLAIATLSLFWILSGIIGFASLTQATSILVQANFSSGLAHAAAFSGACVDLLLGLAILYRPATKRAAIGMIVVSFLYLLAATFYVPTLWMDPLGPLVKVIPSITLALFVAATLDER